MAHIIVDDETAKAIHESSDNLEIRDKNGMILGFIIQCQNNGEFSPEEIQQALNRSADPNRPRKTWLEIKERMKQLESKS